MLISENVRLKYNRLYREVAEYYNLEHKINIGNDTEKLDYIQVTEFGIPSNTVQEIVKQLEQKFIYLVPFYKFFHRDTFFYKVSPELIFFDMNRVIRKIREEKKYNLQKEESMPDAPIEYGDLDLDAIGKAS